MEIQETIHQWHTVGNLPQNAAGARLFRGVPSPSTWRPPGPPALPRIGRSPPSDQLIRLSAISQVGQQRPETPRQDRLEPWADQTYQWLTGDRLQVTRIHELLAARGCVVSYSPIRRFFRKRNWGRRSVRTARMADTAPGEVAEVDFGELGSV